MKLNNNPIVFVTRDLERALGLPLSTVGYYIITNYSAFANKLAKKYRNILLIKRKELLDTHELLARIETKRFIGGVKSARILVFKNTVLIEEICRKNNWPLLNSSAELAATVEEKISQLSWLGDLKKYLPPHQLIPCGLIKWPGKKFILQFNRAHTGSGTILIKNKKQLRAIQSKFPRREARVTRYISGPMFTNNNVVWGEKVLNGNISYQITGLFPFTALPFATVGNDWALPNKLLTKSQLKTYFKIARAAGNKLAQAGYKGLFGVDIIKDEKTGKLYLIEINARQPASTSFESVLQDGARRQNKLGGLTTFEAHLMSLSGVKYGGENLVKIKDGAQVIKRVGVENKVMNTKIVQANISSFSRQDYNVILYNNQKLETDWLRIQSKFGIMEGHNFFNNHGSVVINFVFSCVANMYYGTKRASVLIIKANKVLLIQRFKKHCRPYFVVPGGTIEKNESPAQAALREVKEETNLKVSLDTKFIHFKPNQGDNNREDFCFIAQKFNGHPKIVGEEKRFNRPENAYALKWVDIKKIKNLLLFPAHLKKYLLEKYN